MTASSHIETLAIHAGREPDTTSGAVAPTLTLSSTFQRAADGSYPQGHIYGRASNPNRDSLETCLAALEGGAAAAAFSSGSAASLAVFQTLRSGDHVLLPDDVYHGTRAQLRDVMAPWGLAYTEVDMSDLDAVRAALQPRTRLIWAETPSNPLLKLTDIAAMSEIAKRQGARLAVDNTFATPVLQRPLALGADLVVHSTSKYLGGHSDIIGGAVIGARADDGFAKIREIQGKGGAVPSPFDCWLLQRSIATLPLRVRAQSASAQRVAEFLAGQPQVAAVHYPGLPGDPGYALGRSQMQSGGAMLSFRVRTGEAAAQTVAANLGLFTQATSLGGVESLIEHRASVEGPQSRTPRDLLRVSIGLEHVDDLIADLDQALRAG